MKATSSIGSAAGTDKAFGLSAASSTNGADASSGGGFLAMLDGMIQTLNAGQTPTGNNGSHGSDQSGADASDETDALAAAGDEASDDLTLADADTTSVATTPSVTVAPTLTNAITLGAAAASTAGTQPVAAKTSTAPTALSDDALAALAVQAGVVPVAVPIAAPVQPDVTASSNQTAAVSVATVLPAQPLAAGAAAATAASQAAATNVSDNSAVDQAVQVPVASTVIAAAPTITFNGQTPAKPAVTQSDLDNSDSQQSAILSALFAQAPLQTIVPTVSADASASKTQGSSPVSGAASAGPASVLGVGIPPTLSPPAFVGNGNHLANQQGLVSSAVFASNDADDDAQATPAHVTPVVAGPATASFGIGTDTSTSDTTSDNSDDSDAALAQSTPAQISSDAVKADAIAALFAAPQAKTTSKTASSDDAATPVANTATPSVQAGTPGLTFVHQSITVGATATATTANATAASATAYAPPAEQVSLVLQRAAATGTQSMTIALDPIELGKVEVKLDFAKDGSVQASVTAERPETLTLLKNDHSTLTQALHNAGLSTNSNSLSFNLRDGSNSSQQQQGFGSASSYRGRVDVTANADDTVSTPSTTVQYAVSSDNGRLNVIV